MLPIALLLIVWLPALVGLGWPVLSLLRRAAGGAVGGVARRTAVAGLLGIFVASIAASAVGLVLPVRPGVSVVLLCAGWASAARYRRSWTRLPRRAWVAAVGLAAVVVVLDARGLPWYDTGLYHLQAVAWSADGPLPRGLANLHGPLGYDCSWFAFAPVVEFPSAAGRACFVVNAVLVVLAALPGVDAVIRTARPARRARPIRADAVVFAVALFPLAEYAGRFGMVSSLAPDPIVMTLVAFATAVWVRSPRNALLAATLAVFAVTVKLSAGPLAVAAVVAAVVGRRSIRRPGLAWVAVGLWVVAGAVWLARGVWLSGCPLFPSTVGRLAGLPWSVTPADARFTEQAIEYWSKYRRYRSDVLPGTPWIGPWIRRVGLAEPVVVPTAILLFGAVRLAAGHWPTTPAGRRAVVAAIALVPAVAFWFAVAPDPRFGIGYFCTAASLLVTAGWDGVPWPARWRPSIVAGVLAVALLVVIRADHRLFRLAVVRWPAIPLAKLVVRPAADGTPVRVPVGDDRVWAAPRPATPDLNPTLRCVTDAAGRVREFDVTRPRVAP